MLQLTPTSFTHKDRGSLFSMLITIGDFGGAYLLGIMAIASILRRRYSFFFLFVVFCENIPVSVLD